MLARIIWVLVMAGLATAMAGWWFDWDWANTFSISGFNDTLTNWSKSLDEESVKNIPDKVTGIIDGGTGVVRDIFGEAIDKQKEAALSTYGDVRGSVVEEAKAQIDQILKSLEGGLGLNSDSSDIELSINGQQASTSFSVVMAVKAGEPISFLIKNKSYNGADYVIDWGDGGENNGSLAGDEEKIISHVWNGAGDYTVAFGNKEFVIRVIE
ncbi:MAG: hypothetical protein ABH822_01830 [Patescibacteria group bacterium]